jgi:hypothetical protein
MDRPLIRKQLVELAFGNAPIEQSDISNIDLFSVAAEEGVNGFLWQRLSDTEGVIEEDFARSLETQLRELQLRYMRMQHACGRVLATLDQANIPVICMRGVSVTELLYGDGAALRPISDMDLLIDERQMLNAKQALWDIGFRPDSKYRNIYFRGDISIDLHHEPLGIERIQMWKYLTPLRIDDFMKHAREGELAGETALLLLPRVYLPYLCFHALKHSFERLIWLRDIALLANRVSQSRQWNEVSQGIREYRLERPCYYALTYVKEHFGAVVPEELLEKIRPKMGFVERNLFKRHMNHEVIPFLAERLFARMQPDFSHRIRFWMETIYPRYEVRAQMVETGCVKCNFIRKRLKQFAKAGLMFMREGLSLIR